MRNIALLISSLLLTTVLFAQKSILIKNITLIDVEKGVALKNANVLVRGQLIDNISFGKPAATADSIIDGSNRFLIPGLWDMHTHVFSDVFTFPLLIANGVTGIRDMFDNMYNMRYWRGKIADGKIAGPEMVIECRLFFYSKSK
jgi:hypothetical protein